MFITVEKKPYQPRILYPAELPFRSDEEITKIEGTCCQWMCLARNKKKFIREKENDISKKIKYT